MTQNLTNTDNKNYIKIFAGLMAVVIAFLLLFYFACGEELYSRDSNGNIDPFGATNDAGELPEGTTISQSFTADMDSIETIGVMVSNYGRELTSSLNIKCIDRTTNTLLADQSYSCSEIGINQYIYLDTAGFQSANLQGPAAMSALRGHLIELIISSDAAPGDAPTVLYNVENQIHAEGAKKDARLAINWIPSPGTLCITVQGRDNVWTGPNYPKLAALAAAAVAIAYWLSVARLKSGKSDYIFSTWEALKKYKFLIQQLVSRDFKVRYKRSILGVMWSLLNPLMTMTVQYVVFSHLFRSNIDNFPVYLMSGLVVFNFFTEGVGQALVSIIGNSALISKVYMPKYVYPITRVLSSCINLVMSLIPLLIMVIITGEPITRAYLLLPFILICVLIFTIGFGMLLATGMVFFRDIQFLWGVLSMVWMYLTPMFYPVSILPETIRGLMKYNPMYNYIGAFRNIVLDGKAPQPTLFFTCAVTSVAMLLIGAWVFKKNQDKFIFYI